jgi:hypothetical protein
MPARWAQHEARIAQANGSASRRKIARPPSPPIPRKARSERDDQTTKAEAELLAMTADEMARVPNGQGSEQTSGTFEIRLRTAASEMLSPGDMRPFLYIPTIEFMGSETGSLLLVSANS